MAIYFPDTNTLYVHFPKTGGCTFYAMLETLKPMHEIKGFQHDAVDMLGSEIFKLKPHVLIWTREKESWIESYHRWRGKNPDPSRIYPGTSEFWHPFWILEDIYTPDYQAFRHSFELICPRYYEILCERYYYHPTFKITKFPSEHWNSSMNKMLDIIGIKRDINFVQDHNIVNATRVFS